MNEVSVPSRGNGVIDHVGSYSRYGIIRAGFRPLSGKWGYRYCIYSRIVRNELEWFPSPLGEMGLSIYSTPVALLGMIDGFPSPLGEMGLSIYQVRDVWAYNVSCFRPLSGKWGYRLVRFAGMGRSNRARFRPLSGKWGYR